MLCKLLLLVKQKNAARKAEEGVWVWEKKCTVTWAVNIHVAVNWHINTKYAWN